MGIWNPFTKMYEPRTSEIADLHSPHVEKMLYSPQPTWNQKQWWCDKKIPNRKLTCPRKMDQFKRIFHLPTINFQGDMLVFREVSIYTYICILLYTFLHVEPGLFQAPCYLTGCVDIISEALFISPKLAILRTYTPLRYRFIHPSIGGSQLILRATYIYL